MLPEIVANQSAEGGARILSRLGVDADFIDGVQSKYSPHASRFGLSAKALNPIFSAIKNAMGRGGSEQRRTKKESFDRSKYPMV